MKPDNKPQDNKTTATRPRRRSIRIPAWLVSALCVLGTGAALYLTGVFPGETAPAEAREPAAGTVTPEGASPDEVILAYTVNNLGYTSTCG